VLPPFEELLASVESAIQQDIVARDGQLISGLIEKPVLTGLAEAGLVLSEQQWKRLRLEFYRPYDELVFPRQGLHPTLEALDALHYRLGLISNTYWASDVHDRHLARYDVLDLLPVRIYSCEVSHSKPHPSIFMEAVRRLGLEPGQVVYVGDRPDVDVAGAQNAGLHGILIRTPFRPIVLGEVVPDAIINELPELLPVLEELKARL
jgi:HAD superfamily hydrolase (TIGR01549 family)